MMTRKLFLFLTGALFAFSALLNQAIAQAPAADERQQAMEHKFEKAKEYHGECKHTEAAEFDTIRPYLKAFTDVEVMADVMSDPGELAKLMEIVSDPRTVHVMMKCSSEPVMWDTWFKGMTDLKKLASASLRFMNPMMYYNWAMAPVNPQIYQSLMNSLSLTNLGRWGTALANPTFYQPLYEPLTSLNWWGPRYNWLIDPKSYQPMVDMLTTLPAPIEGAPEQAGTEEGSSAPVASEQQAPAPTPAPAAGAISP